MPQVFIVGLDTFARKNISQINLMNEKGFFYDILTGDFRKDSVLNFQQVSNKNRLFIGQGSILKRFLLFLKLLFSRRYHHAEIYSAARMAVFYLPFLRLLRIPIISIERGDIGLIQGYSRLTRNAIKYSHWSADVVWFRERYMEDLLKNITRARLYFLPNAAPAIQFPVKAPQRDIDFIWVNRIIPQRRADWLLDSLNSPELISAKAYILGLQSMDSRLEDHAASLNSNLEEYILNNKREGIELYGYVSPFEYYFRSKFFVLPAEIVFGNNSLLESMAAGVIPIVSNTTWTSEIVVDGYNGIVFNHSYEGLHKALKYAISLTDKQRYQLSENVKNFVKEHFSQESWSEKCENLYNYVKTHKRTI